MQAQGGHDPRKQLVSPPPRGAGGQSGVCPLSRRPRLTHDSGAFYFHVGFPSLEPHSESPQQNGPTSEITLTIRTSSCLLLSHTRGPSVHPPPTT